VGSNPTLSAIFFNGKKKKGVRRRTEIFYGI
jgi:hypothetical protein